MDGDRPLLPAPGDMLSPLLGVPRGLPVGGDVVGGKILPHLAPPPPQEEHKQLSSMLGCEVTSMLCVPVISRATSQVVALACAFNKLSGDR